MVSPTLKIKNRILNTNNLNEEKMIYTFLEKNTNENDMVVILPLFNTRKLNIAPLRPNFMSFNNNI